MLVSVEFRSPSTRIMRNQEREAIHTNRDNEYAQSEDIFNIYYMKQALEYEGI